MFQENIYTPQFASEVFNLQAFLEQRLTVTFVHVNSDLLESIVMQTIHFIMTFKPGFTSLCLNGTSISAGCCWPGERLRCFLGWHHCQPIMKSQSKCRILEAVSLTCRDNEMRKRSPRSSEVGNKRGSSGLGVDTRPFMGWRSPGSDTSL